MSQALHSEELHYILNSPTCLACDHRQVWHWSGEVALDALGVQAQAPRRQVRLMDCHPLWHRPPRATHKKMCPGP